MGDDLGKNLGGVVFSLHSLPSVIRVSRVCIGLPGYGHIQAVNGINSLLD